MNKDYYRMLGELQAIDFVILELNLYLDTHPDDPQARQQYDEYSRVRKQLKERFEDAFGPLNNYGASPTFGNWSSSPWPWQV
ncbi:spore coat protein CotJB [Marinithermofilum abyssi]|uniref:Spore coat protein CotJB n=1 Tax=Marinithermofilum abyssi TaxID=1571185 RepID=A0A8J2YCU8_9BACL|nr:spore coat protein CotJB [Marinithermofilum abyssi]GGE19103.1 spore coat protein CotJB [Marinithermofilum abyssi]